jgi:hypothetical protein
VAGELNYPRARRCFPEKTDSNKVAGMTERFQLLILYILAAIAGLSCISGILFVAWTYK